MSTNAGMDDIEKVLRQLETLTNRDAIDIRREIEKIVHELRELLVSKGGDYSSIFEHEFGAPVVASKIGGTSVHQFFTTLIGLKAARAINISHKKGTPTYEDLKGTWGDLLNYMILWLACTRYMEGLNAICTDSADQLAERL